MIDNLEFNDEPLQNEVNASSLEKPKRKARAKRANSDGIDGNNPEVAQFDDREIDAFMDAWDNNILPDPPQQDDGYHYFWASTTNKWDSIEARLRGGYQYAKPEHIKNFDSYHFQTRMNAGQFGSDNVISCNEMILLRCPKALFEKRMEKYHHQQPYEHQRSIVDHMRGVTDRLGVKTETPLEQGMLEMEAEAKRIKSRPSFFVNEHNKKMFE